MKQNSHIQYKSKIREFQNQKFLKGINLKTGQGNFVTWTPKSINYKLINNISREPDYIISSNLINQNPQRQSIQNNNLNCNNPSDNKSKINYRHSKDDIKDNQIHQRPENGDIITEKVNENDHLFNNSNINNINKNNIIKFSFYHKEPKDDPNTFPEKYANLVRPKQQKKLAEKISINSVSYNSPENKTKYLKQENFVKSQKQLAKKKQMNITLNSSNKKHKDYLLDTSSKDDKKRPYFSQNNFYQKALFRTKKEDNFVSNKKQSINENEALSKTNLFRTKSFSNYFENNIKGINASKNNQSNNKNETEKIKKHDNVNRLEIDAKNRTNEKRRIFKNKNSVITNSHSSNELDIMKYKSGMGFKLIMTKEKNKNIGTMEKKDELKKKNIS